MNIKILGMGCPNCKRLEENTREAIKQLGVKAEIIKITEPQDIMKYGIMSTPAIVADEKVISYGLIPNIEEIKKLLTK